jgi:hypothetical protein
MLFETNEVHAVTVSSAPLTWIGMQPSTRALYRWSGRALVDGAERDWSLILKAWLREPKTDLPTVWNYWKREFLAYSSGLLDEVPGIAVPRLLGAVDEDALAYLWLEDVSEAEPRWNADRYVLAARHLGRFNGAYLADRPLPEAGFLTRRYLRSWTNWLPWLDSARARESWSHPIVADAITMPPIDRLERLHAKVAFLFDRLEALPQTFSHLDAWRANLIGARSSTGADRTVAIDWSFVGMAPAGQELAICVGGSHIWLDAEPQELASMSARAFIAYVEGLRDAGWRGEERVVRFAYAASTALYLAPILPFWLARVADPARRQWIERKCGRDVSEVVRGWALLLDHALDLADEAYVLAERLGEGH